MPIEDFPHKAFGRIGGRDVIELGDHRLYRELERLHGYGPRLLYELLADTIGYRGLVTPTDWFVYHQLAQFHTGGPHVVCWLLTQIGQRLLLRSEIDRAVERFTACFSPPERRRL